MHTKERRREELQRQQDDEWLDEALSETFPASDPIPSFHGDRDIGSRLADESRDLVESE